MQRFTKHYWHRLNLLKITKEYMKKLTLLLLAMILCFNLSVAGNLKILSSNGDKPYYSTTASPDNWKKLNIGKVLDSTVILKLNKTNMNIIYNNGNDKKIIKLDGPGTFNYNTIIKLVSKNTTVLDNFIGYLSDEITDNSSLLNSKSYRDNMELTGSVERSLKTQSFMLKDVNINAPDKQYFSTNLVSFLWDDSGDFSDKYEFIIYDRFSRTIASFTTSEKYVSFDLTKHELKKDVYYFCTVKKNEMESTDKCFICLSKSTMRDYKDTVYTIRNNVADERLQLLILTSYYEQNHLINEAVNAYEDLIAKYRTDYYVELYRKFLKRNNIYRTGL